MEKVLNLYKKEGETPLETMEEFRNENLEYKNIKMTYAGRLDPMAEGVLIVLVGDECKNKEKYLGLDKEYEFEILWGFKTDTYDILGFPTWLTYSQVDKNKELNSLFFETQTLDVCELVGKFEQEYPPYSSKTVGGKQLFELARSGEIENVEIPKKEVEIYNIEHLGNYEMTRKELEKNIVERVSKVKGDFRQKEIIKKWKEVMEKKEYEVSKFRIKCSSGTYVRGIANRLGGIAFRIKRTKIG